MEQQMLKDKVAIITGASYGMGQTMAELFASTFLPSMAFAPSAALLILPPRVL